MLEEYFSIGYMEDYFIKNLLHKKGGGIDKISPLKYWDKNREDFELIAKKCIESTYKFSAYRENLILKGRDKKPRVIVIPTVRDRLVLGILNSILQNIFTDCIQKDLPNAYIHKIKDYMSLHSGRPIYFYQTDIKSFYDTISHSILLSKLRRRISDERIISLIEISIKNTIVDINNANSSFSYNDRGIPQGLAISNILAQIYLQNIDNVMTEKDGLYLRYVDDILLLSADNHVSKKLIQKEIARERLNISPEKTLSGDLRYIAIDYLGYSLNAKKISVKNKNIHNFINRIAAKCTLFDSGWKNKHLRPRYMVENDQLYKEVFFHELNLMICGAKDNKKKYGWLVYFSQLNDGELIFRLNKIIDNLILRIDAFKGNRPTEIKKITRAYFDITRNRGEKYIFDYDNITTVAEKKDYLSRLGQINDATYYTEEQIEIIYTKYKDKKLTGLEKDSGKKY
ncbi:reverse transcriptase/maturase family protein [Parabacteroides sp. OttesenSCG-928-O15]|nr:reverse transcriptase/maturase family protein [Parabacteroides sp. OttesenSCG-928-O15]